MMMMISMTAAVTATDRMKLPFSLTRWVIQWQAAAAAAVALDRETYYSCYRLGLRAVRESEPVS